MRAVSPATPDVEISEALKRYQDEVDQEPDYLRRVTKAVELWKTGSKSAVFSRVRALLVDMCSDEYCMYCERSVADQLEHFKPKALYPESVFTWANFLFICHPCNRGKWDRFAVFSSVSGDPIDVTRKRGAPPQEPEHGTPLLINPREEDPADFLVIDFLDTCLFVPRAAEGTREYVRAGYTTNELLDLNSAGHRRARQNAFRAFKVALREYVRLRDQGEVTGDCIEVIRGNPHRGVWAAMKRDRETIPEVLALFVAAPEALGW